MRWVGRKVLVGGRLLIGTAPYRAAAEERQCEERSKGRHGSSNDTDAFLDDRPETNLTRAEHEFCLVVVEGQVAQSNDGGAARTRKQSASV